MARKTRSRPTQPPVLPYKVRIHIDRVRQGWHLRPLVFETQEADPKLYALPDDLFLGIGARLSMDSREVAEAEALELALELLGRHAEHVEVLREDRVLATYGPETDRWAAQSEMDRPRPIPIGLTKRSEEWLAQYGKHAVPLPARDGDTIEGFLRMGMICLLFYSQDLRRLGLVIYNPDTLRVEESLVLTDPGEINLVTSGDPEGVSSAEAVQNLFDYVYERK